MEFPDKLLINYKDQLKQSLRTNYAQYLHILKHWFRGKISKKEFDRRSSHLFSADTVALHNQFMLAILSCSDSKTVSDKKRHRAAKSLKQRFTEQPQMPFLNIIHPPAGRRHSDAPRKDFSLITTSCVREQSLPAVWMLYGRVMNSLQMYGLTEVYPTALTALVVAVRALVRRLLQSALARRRCCLLKAGDSGAERTNFGRAGVPLLSLTPGFITSLRGERFPARSWSQESLGGSLSSEALRMKALLQSRRCPDQGARLTVDDLFHAITDPDSGVVNSLSLQRHPQAVNSHLVRFLCHSRVLSRLGQMSEPPAAAEASSCVEVEEMDDD